MASQPQIRKTLSSDFQQLTFIQITSLDPCNYQASPWYWLINTLVAKKESTDSKNASKQDAEIEIKQGKSENGFSDSIMGYSAQGFESEGNNNYLLLRQRILENLPFWHEKLSANFAVVKAIKISLFELVKGTTFHRVSWCRVGHFFS